MNNIYLPENTFIAIIGGGNIGTQFACMCAHKGYNVNVYSSKPQNFDGTLEIVDENNVITLGKVKKVTSNLAEAVKGCNFIFVTYPAFMLEKIADELLPYVSLNTNIFVIPGTGGAEFAFRNCIKKGATLVGLQRVPSVARLEKYGKRVRCEGLRKELVIASIPNKNVEMFADFFANLWDIKCVVLPNYLNVTLTPSNPILHTTRLSVMFADYLETKVYKRNPLFYGEWDDASSELLLSCDEELQSICRELNELDLKAVRSLKYHYESSTVEEMTKKLSSIKSLCNLKSPMCQIKEGWVPDFKSRYFTADFPYGLSIIESFAKVLRLDIPNIKKTMDWYKRITGDTREFNISKYGINTKEEIYEFYAT